MGVLHRLVDTGNTVILIEHNLDVIKNADWVIDLGPGAGDKGGRLIAVGTPEQIAKHNKSLTGRYVKKALEAAAGQPPAADAEPAPPPKKRRAAPRKQNRGAGGYGGGGLVVFNWFSRVSES